MSADDWPKKTVFKFELEQSDRFAAEFAEFERHEEDLLGILRKVHQGYSQSQSFDEVHTLYALRRAANWFFKRQKQRHDSVLPARRVERLRDFAKLLRRARQMAYKLVQDEIGWDLFWAWRAVTPAKTASEQLAPAKYFTEELRKLLNNIANLETIAQRASCDIPVRVGVPRGTGVLSDGDINTLQGLYLRSTGQNPSMTASGRFAKFVEVFLVAVGQSEQTSQDYVAERFKSWRKQMRKAASR